MTTTVRCKKVLDESRRAAYNRLLGEVDGSSAFCTLDVTDDVRRGGAPVAARREGASPWGGVVRSVVVF